MKKLVMVGLVALLVLGLAGIASALWTDTEYTTIHGSTGSVDIKTKTTLSFDPYIQPGESLIVRWWVKNKGLCPVTIEVTVTGVPWYLTHQFYPGLNLGTLQPGMERNVALRIWMADYMGQLNKANKEFTVIVTFIATQNQNRTQ